MKSDAMENAVSNVIVSIGQKHLLKHIILPKRDQFAAQKWLHLYPSK